MMTNREVLMCKDCVNILKKKIEMKFILVMLIFCMTLFLYLHVFFHLKTSDDLKYLILNSCRKISWKKCVICDNQCAWSLRTKICHASVNVHILAIIINRSMY